MYTDNYRLGQAQILAVYADPGHELIDPWSPPTIRGRLQSGWDLVMRPDPVRDLFPFFAWSDGARARRIARGAQPGFVLGAAWAYLLKTDRDAFRSEEELERRAEEPPTPVVAEGMLYLPHHGLQGRHLAQRIAGHLLQTVGVATIALSPADFAVPDIEQAYRMRGHTVAHLAGERDEPGSDAPRPLVQLRDVFAAHSCVGSNVPRAELLYAAAGGLTVSLCGPMVQELDPVQQLLGRRLADFDAREWRRYADAELGISHVVPPDELRALLDWTHHV